MADANKTTEDLIKAWQRACLAKSQAEETLKLRDSDLSEAEKELGTHLMPSDVKLDEIFSIWVRRPYTDKDSLLIVKYVGMSRYQFSWRSK